MRFLPSQAKGPRERERKRERERERERARIRKERTPLSSSKPGVMDALQSSSILGMKV
jgi:hypothetical protein